MSALSCSNSSVSSDALCKNSTCFWSTEITTGMGTVLMNFPVRDNKVLLYCIVLITLLRALKPNFAI